MAGSGHRQCCLALFLHLQSACPFRSHDLLLLARGFALQRSAGAWSAMRRISDAFHCGRQPNTTVCPSRWPASLRHKFDRFGQVSLLTCPFDPQTLPSPVPNRVGVCTWDYTSLRIPPCMLQTHIQERSSLAEMKLRRSAREKTLAGPSGMGVGASFHACITSGVHMQPRSTLPCSYTHRAHAGAQKCALSYVHVVMYASAMMRRMDSWQSIKLSSNQDTAPNVFHACGCISGSTFLLLLFLLCCKTAFYTFARRFSFAPFFSSVSVIAFSLFSDSFFLNYKRFALQIYLHSAANTRK